MRSHTPELLALLNSGNFESLDLWVLKLNGGQILRYCASDHPKKWQGQEYKTGPLFMRGGIEDQMGLKVSNLDLTIAANSTDLVNGVPLIRMIRGRGLDGAQVQLFRAFMPSIEDEIVGVVNRFSGKLSSVENISGGSAQFTLSSWAILLNVNIPVNVYQASCMHVVYNTGCGVDPETKKVTAALEVGSTKTLLNIDATPTVGYLDQGRVVFLTGPNTGVTRAIKRNYGVGQVQLVSELPSTPTVGDQAAYYPGCDLSRDTCANKFNNILRHKATPFVPVPETAL